jgi:RNA polymerase sigma-70 factor (ECF subfamily)
MFDIRNTVTRILQGDTQAFRLIIEHYQTEIWRILSLSMQDQSITEDLLQEVFISAYKNLDKYDRERDFAVWLRTIARNTLRNHIKENIRENKKLKSYNEYLTSQLESESSPEFFEDTLHQNLVKCIERLSPNANKALQLRYEQSYSFEKIARLLGRTLVATRQLLTRARIAIRRCVENRMAAE